MRYAMLLSIALAGCSQSPILVGSETPPQAATVTPPHGDAGTPASSSRFISNTFATGEQPLSIVTGDFDEDGKVDLIVSNNFSSDISFGKGNGDGTFQPGTRRSGAYGLLAKGDFDGNGHLDLVVGAAGRDPYCTKNEIAVLLGNGDGTFRDGAAYGDDTISLDADGPAVGDLNGDGVLDLVYGIAIIFDDTTGLNQIEPWLAVRLGQGDGTFSDERRFDIGTPFPSGVTVADFNTDGKLDVLVGTTGTFFAPEAGSGSLALFFGNGDGSLQAQQPVANNQGPCGTLVLLDFNHDGIEDIASEDCSGRSGVYADLLAGAGDGSFTLVRSVQTEANILYALGTADFDGDGDPDLVYPNTFPGVGYGEDSIVAFLMGASRSTHAVPDAEATVGRTPRVLAIDDFNHDGRPDVAVVNQDSNTVTILVNASGTQIQ